MYVKHCIKPLNAQRHRSMGVQSTDPLIVQSYQPKAQIGGSPVTYVLYGSPY